MSKLFKLLSLFIILATACQCQAQSIDLRLLEHINGSVNTGPDSRWRFVSLNAALGAVIIIGGTLVLIF